ncbi:hypothetical protein H4R34_002801 [Dimargaris verticillata]|uniref:HbrB-like-domain-containing protein n=1 Tax=Dimargaris verticillata TaxID=2761393 RepID=A0A9W8B7D4_9FUNG|nr:hypothetical protein H4R34_002801 [Dimargaris verticillata]
MDAKYSTQARPKPRPTPIRSATATGASGQGLAYTPASLTNATGLPMLSAHSQASAHPPPIASPHMVCAAYTRPSVAALASSSQPSLVPSKQLPSSALTKASAHLGRKPPKLVGDLHDTKGPSTLHYAHGQSHHAHHGTVTHLRHPAQHHPHHSHSHSLAYRSTSHHSRQPAAPGYGNHSPMLGSPRLGPASNHHSGVSSPATSAATVTTASGHPLIRIATSGLSHSTPTLDPATPTYPITPGIGNMSTSTLPLPSPYLSSLTHPSNHSLNVSSSGGQAGTTPPSNLTLNNGHHYSGTVINTSTANLAKNLGAPYSPSFKASSPAIHKSLTALDAKTMTREISSSLSEVANPNDPWSILCINLLPLFNGKEPPKKIEELCELVIMVCNSATQSKDTATVPYSGLYHLYERIKELFATGMINVSGKLQSTSEEKLISKLGDTWHLFSRMILPRLQGIFIPLVKLQARTAATHSSVTNANALGLDFDVRYHLTLCLRDLVVLPILPRIEASLTHMAHNPAMQVKHAQYIPRIFQMMAMLSMLHTGDEYQTLTEQIWGQVRQLFLHMQEYE